MKKLSSKSLKTERKAQTWLKIMKSSSGNVGHKFITFLLIIDVVYYVLRKLIMNTEMKHNTNAPIIPSCVFFGDMPWAKGLLPMRLPNIKPPLSACHDKQKTRAIKRGLKESTLILLT